MPLQSPLLRIRRAYVTFPFAIALLLSVAGGRSVYAQTSSDWHAVDMCIGNINLPRILWTNPDGRATVWATIPSYGGGVGLYTLLTPASGFSAIALSEGGDTKSRVLFRNSDEHISIHRINTSGVDDFSVDFAPPTDTSGLTWSAVDMDTTNATSNDNKTYVLWQRSDGLVCVWRLNVDLVYEAESRFSAPSGAIAQHIAADELGKVRVELLQGGRNVNYLTLGTSLAQENSAVFVAPSFDVSPFGLASRDDGTSLLGWSTASGTANLWNISPSSVKQGESTYAPPGAGWNPVGVGALSDGRPKTLWSAPNGEAQIWNHAADGTLQSMFRYNVTPTNLQTTAGPGYVDLSWDEIAIKGAYSMYRSTSSDSGFYYLGSVSTASYRDTNVTPGTPYYYRIVMYGGAVESGASATKSATPTDPNQPTPTPSSSIDARIYNGTSWIGENVISPVASGEEALRQSTAGGTTTYFVGVKRLGNTSNQAIRLTVPEYSTFENERWSATFCRVSSLQDPYTATDDITDDITGTDGYSTNVSSGQEVLIRIDIKAPLSAIANSTQALLIKAQDDDGSASPSIDAVKANVKIVDPSPSNPSNPTTPPPTAPYLERIEWSKDGVNWQTVNGAIPLLRGQSFGLRAVAHDPINHPWEETLDYVPTWSVTEPGATEPSHIIGEMIWVAGDSLGSWSFSATCGRTLSGSFSVSPDPDDIDDIDEPEPDDDEGGTP